jgi:hypothetical protein
MDRADEEPFVSYALLMAVWGVSFAGFLGALQRRRGLPRRLPLSDLALVGIATHKVSRLITREKVTAPVRAPFIDKVEGSGPTEARERPAGQGLRRALGNLLTCPYCTGPWVAGALVCGLAAAPRPTRLVSSVFSAVALSDFLHQAFEGLSARNKILKRDAARPQ